MRSIRATRDVGVLKPLAVIFQERRTGGGVSDQRHEGRMRRAGMDIGNTLSVGVVGVLKSHAVISGTGGAESCRTRSISVYCIRRDLHVTWRISSSLERPNDSSLIYALSFENCAAVCQSIRRMNPHTPNL